MRITYQETEAIRELAETGKIDELADVSVTDVDMYAAVELACCRFLNNESHRALFPFLQKWASQSPTLAFAIQTMMTGQNPPRVAPFQSRAWEFFPITNPKWNNNDHHLFESRFTSGVRDAGFGKKAIALAGAFFEMADNVTQHSGISTDKVARGILAYQINTGQMTFAVGDVGRGVLASLAENPAWTHIKDSADALEAAVKNYASRRTDLGPGHGFRQVFKSLADMNGHLVFRSGNGVLTIEGKADKRVATKSFATPFPGFQLSVTCSIK